jgi:hypothetical protein
VRLIIKNEILVGLNARYNDLLDLLIGEGCKVIKSVNRMLLEGYEGKYLENSPDFVMRVWHALPYLGVFRIT